MEDQVDFEHDDSAQEYSLPISTENTTKKREEKFADESNQENGNINRNSGIDRTKTCPFVCQVYQSERRIHRLEGTPTTVHCWSDTTLREIILLLSITNPEILNKDRIFIRSMLISRDKELTSRYLGRINGKRKSKDDDRTLKELKYQQGDVINVFFEEENRYRQ